ncbi:hypothetical protein HXX76_006318 [Chlamydomonas incerta]|uniref:cyclin-dependent kinase n=1 Tax=Chlamydomonas incerta TaxID=51695 RepID=A0A835T0W9_CHLIN|nr:hypothetical protein HXX76_006318 [Chlamydomonas incerta]|eukprot:KAG2436794.1 hypothetical protein HXX76_006318 [Chlamydomonas incerta]
MQRYTYVSTLGEGAYGTVWRCTDNETGQDVAVKALKKAHEDPVIMRLAVREVKVLRKVAHPNCVKLLDAFKSKTGRVYMVFDFVGPSAHDLLDAHPDGLPHGMLKLVCWQLLRAAAYLHQSKFLHRDIKPANLLMDTRTGVAQLCDFGFARPCNSGAKEVEPCTSYVVTRWYRSPEVLVGAPYGPASDVWSIGCTIAELAAGRPLFAGSSTADQLRRIMRCLGPLAPPHMARIASDPRLAGVQLPEPHLTLRQRLPGLDARLLALIYCCLQPDPQLRLTAAELLQMPYFLDVHKLAQGSDVMRSWLPADATGELSHVGGSSSLWAGSNSTCNASSSHDRGVPVLGKAAAAVAVGGAAAPAGTAAVITTAVPMDVSAEEIAPAAPPSAGASAAAASAAAVQPHRPPAVAATAPVASAAAYCTVEAASAGAGAGGPAQQQRHRLGRRRSVSFSSEQQQRVTRLEELQQCEAAEQGQHPHPHPQQQAAVSFASGIKSGPAGDFQQHGRRSRYGSGGSRSMRVKHADVAAAAVADLGHGSDATAATLAAAAASLTDGTRLLFSRACAHEAAGAAGADAITLATPTHTHLRASRGSISALGGGTAARGSGSSAAAAGDAADGGSSSHAAGAAAPAAAVGPVTVEVMLTPVDVQQQYGGPMRGTPRPSISAQQPSAPSGVAPAAGGGGAGSTCGLYPRGQLGQHSAMNPSCWSMLTTSISEHMGAAAAATGPAAVAAGDDSSGRNASAAAAADGWREAALMMSLGLLASRSPSPTPRVRIGAAHVRGDLMDAADAAAAGSSGGRSSNRQQQGAAAHAADGGSNSAYLRLSLDATSGPLALSSVEGGGLLGDARTAAVLAAAANAAAAAASAGRRSHASTFNGGGAASTYTHLSTHGSLLLSPGEAPAAAERERAIGAAAYPPARQDRSAGYAQVPRQQHQGGQQQSRSSQQSRRPPLALLLSTVGSTGGGGMLSTMDTICWEESMTPTGAPSIHASLRSGLLPHVRPAPPLNPAQQLLLQQRSSRGNSIAFRAAFPTSCGGAAVAPVSSAAVAHGGGMTASGASRAAVASLDRTSSYSHRLSNSGGLGAVLGHVVSALGRATSVTSGSPLTSQSYKRAHGGPASCGSGVGGGALAGVLSLHSGGGGVGAGGLNAMRISTVEEAEEVSCGNTVRAAAAGAAAALRASNDSEDGTDGDDEAHGCGGRGGIDTLDAGPARQPGAARGNYNAASSRLSSSECRSDLLDAAAAAGSTPPLTAGPSLSSSLPLLAAAMVSPIGTSGAFLRRHKRLMQCASINMSTPNLERSSTGSRLTPPGGQADCPRDGFAAATPPPFGAPLACAADEQQQAAGGAAAVSSNSSKSLFGLGRRAKVAAEVTLGWGGGNGARAVEAQQLPEQQPQQKQNQRELLHPLSAMGVWPASGGHAAISEGQSEGRTSDTGAGSCPAGLPGNRVLAAAPGGGGHRQLQPPPLSQELPAAAAAGSSSTALLLGATAASQRTATRQQQLAAAAGSMPPRAAAGDGSGSGGGTPSGGLRGLLSCVTAGDAAVSNVGAGGGRSKQKEAGSRGGEVRPAAAAAGRPATAAGPGAAEAPHGGRGLKKALARMVKAVKNSFS